MVSVMPANSPAPAKRDPLQLYWRSDSLLKVLQRNGITNESNPRRALAEKIGQPYSTVCATLSADWTGRVRTIPVLTSMCRAFRVKMHVLVIEPMELP